MFLFCLQRVLAKKKLNIPICDVHMDKDYDTNVSATFSLHPSYVKHSKKIGDEVDVSIDYVVDSSDKVCTLILCMLTACVCLYVRP